MPATPTCLEALVGLAPNGLPCFDLPAGDTSWITSSSRNGSAAGPVYITQLAGLSFQPAKSDPASDLYDRLAAARTQAAQYVRQQLTQGNAYAFGKALFTATGTLGKAGNGSVYAGGANLPLQLALGTGGAYLVTAIALATTSPGLLVDVLLDGVVVGTLTTNQPPAPLGPFSSGAAAQPLLLPFDGQTHTLSADLPPGVLPLNGQLFCTTGCNSKAPGSIGYSVSQRLPGVNSNTNSAGFTLVVAEQCQSPDILCYAIDHSDELADSLAQAVVGMSAYYYLLGLLGIAGYDRYTMLKQEPMSNLALQFKQAADQNIAFLSLPIGLGRLQHPCYACLPRPGQPRINNSTFY